MRAVFALVLLFVSGCAHSATESHSSSSRSSDAQSSAEHQKANRAARIAALDAQISNMDAMISGANARVAHLLGSSDPHDQAQVSAVSGEVASYEAQKSALLGERDLLRGR